MSSFDPIDEALDIESSIVEVEPESEIVKAPAEDNRHKEADKDYEYTRANLYSLIEKGQEAVNGALELAQEGDSPRSYEVTGQLIKHVADVADKLLDLQKKVKDLKDEGPQQQTNITNNSVFVGSTSDLQKMLKQGKLNNTSD